MIMAMTVVAWIIVVIIITVMGGMIPSIIDTRETRQTFGVYCDRICLAFA
jgi:hypothetical protein